MARYCSECNKKFGFFEDDFDGMCKNCYDKRLEEERKREYERQQKIKKEQEEKKKREIEEKERLRKIAIEKELELKKQNEIKLKEKIKYVINIITPNKRFVAVVSNAIVSMNKLLDFNIEDRNIIVEMIEYCINKLPENFTYKDIEKINTIKDLKDTIRQFNNKFNINENVLKEYSKDNENQQILSVVCYKDALFNDITKFEEFYNFKIKLLDHSIKECEMDGGDIMLQYALNCKEEKRIENISLIYQIIMSILYGTLFYKPIIDIFEKDNELSVIFNNLIKSKMDKEYIQQKLFEMYKNIYRDKFEEELEEFDFNIITVILMANTTNKYNNSKLYYTVNADKKIEIKYDIIPDEADIIFFKNIVFNFLNEKANEMDFITYITWLSSFETVAKTFEQVWCNKKNKLKAEKERERLLNGDMSKEIEVQMQKVEYSNVGDGYEFEQYVANLYKKLGYTIEEVTKKSGDQRCRCNSI